MNIFVVKSRLRRFWRLRSFFQTQLHNTVRDICWIMKTQTVSIALAALILNLLLITETDCITGPIPGKREVEAKVSFFSLTFYIWYGNQTIIRI